MRDPETTWLPYFLKPFPRSDGFSAYSNTGGLHGLILLIVIVLGWMLCGWHPRLRYLVLIQAFVAVYLGRDLAMFGHSNLSVWIGAVGLFLAGLLYPQGLRDARAWAQGLGSYRALGLGGYTLALVCLWGLVAPFARAAFFSAAREPRAGAPPDPPSAP